MVGDDLSQKSHQKMPFVLSLIFDLEKAVEKILEICTVDLSIHALPWNIFPLPTECIFFG